jgi:hypothetical protein
MTSTKSHKISFYGLGPKTNIIGQNQEHKMKWNKNHIDMLPFLFTSQANVMSLCLPGCRTVHKMLGTLF